MSTRDKGLVEALQGLVDHYCDMINSGDCGRWDPDTDAPIIAARAALAAHPSGKAEEQGAVAFRARKATPEKWEAAYCKWQYVDHRSPDSFELRECEIQSLYLHPPTAAPFDEAKERAEVERLIETTYPYSLLNESERIHFIGGWLAARRPRGSGNG